MPAYDFLCEHCGTFELLLSIPEAGGSAECPICGSGARRVYSMPGVVSTSQTRRKAQRLNERGAEPKVVGDQKECAARRPAHSGGRPWQINH